MRITTINLGGARSLVKKRMIYDYIISNKLDVVALQELSFSNWTLIEDHFLFLSNEGPSGRGTGLLVRKGLEIADILMEPEGRILKAQVENIKILVIYAPSGKAKQGLREIFFRETMPSYCIPASENTIIVGDFNAVESVSDKIITGRRKKSAVECKSLKDAMLALGMQDVWLNKKGGNEVGHTFFHQGGSSRIDRFYVSDDLLNEISNISVTPVCFTDHCTVQIDMERSHRKTQRDHLGKPKAFLWKLNTAVLEEDEYLREIEDLWNNLMNEENFFDLENSKVIGWWENFKRGIKERSILYCKRRAFIRRVNRQENQFELEVIARDIRSGMNRWEDFKIKREEIREWELDQMRGELIRAGTRKIGEEERATVCQINEGRLRREMGNFESIKIDGITLEGQAATIGILNYFKNIFLKNNGSIKAAQGKIFLNSVRDRFKNGGVLITGEITTMEVENAIRKAKKGKAPGGDGIPAEFYAKFWYLIHQVVIKVFNVSLHDGISTSQGTAVVKLIPKRKVDSIADLRPISLLNADYKLMASVLAERLKTALPSLIGSAQRGGVPGRRAAGGLSLTRDLIEKIFMDTEKERSMEKDASYKGESVKSPKGAIVTVDLEKAYDLVNRDVLFAILEAMAIPATFVNKIRALYSNCFLNFFHGSNEIGSVEGKSSIRQGCPLSMFLFILFIEPFIAICEGKLKGFKLGTCKANVMAFVDDLTFFISDETDFVELDVVLKHFSNFSGAVVNKKKTKVMGIGTWNDRKVWPIECITVVEEINILGIPFSKTINDYGPRLWKKIQGQIIGIASTNMHRATTIRDRNLFIKSFMLSRAIYVSRVVPCPDQIAEKILSVTQSFLWGGKGERPPRGVNYDAERDGGVNFLHPGGLFKAGLVHALCETMYGPASPEKFLFNYFCGLSLRNLPGQSKNMSQPHLSLDADPPQYFFNFCNIIKEGYMKGVLKVDGKIDRKELYQMILGHGRIGSKLESRMGHLNWENIWANQKLLSGRLRDIMFLINHDLIQTQVRKKLKKQSANDTCPFCSESETLDHLLANCKAKKDLNDWLRDRFKDLGQTKPLQALLRGDVDGDKKEKSILFAATANLETIRARQESTPPTTADIQRQFHGNLKWQARLKWSL